MRRQPVLVAQLVNCFDAWLVGGSALDSPDAPRDWDVVVSPSKWNQIAQLIPKDAKVNSFGGWKCQSEGCEVDVWPEELNSLLTNHFVKAAYHPRSDTRILIGR
jgi:hypothetical protein